MFKIFDTTHITRDQYFPSGNEHDLPYIREDLTYPELLEAIRTEQLSEIIRLENPSFGAYEPERICLLVDRSGSVKQGYVPPHDLRVWYAAENHNVEIKTSPLNYLSQEKKLPTFTRETMSSVCALAPVVGIGLISAIVYFLTLQSDDDDRKKLRKEKEHRAELQRKHAKEADALYYAYNMANEGKSVEEIFKIFKSCNMSITLEEVDQILSSRKHRVEQNTHTKTELSTNMQHKDPIKEMIRMKAIKNRLQLLHTGENSTILFEDVAGIDDARFELEELVKFLRDPDYFLESGAKIPRGVLLSGPPGTGKTLLARAVAGESGVPFLSVNASEFVMMFQGLGAARVRNLFAEAKEMAPAIIFIDEIDAIGRARSSNEHSPNEERIQTLIQLLSLMDGFDDNAGVIVIGATNRKDVLDPALIRPGRFDRVITVDVPNLDGRVAILNVHIKEHPLKDKLNLREIAYECKGFPGAQLASLVNAAKMYASRCGRSIITSRDLFAALEFERLGPVRSGTLPPELENRSALQESTTALVASLLPTTEEVLTISIIPRENHPLGKTILRMEEERLNYHQYTRNYREDQLVMNIAGKVVEQMFFDTDSVSSISAEKIAQSRRIVASLVANTAMTDSATINSSRTLVSSSNETPNTHVMTGYLFDALHSEVDLVKQNKLGQGMERAFELLVRNRTALSKLLKQLLVKKTLSGDETRAILENNVTENDLELKLNKKSLLL